jgi:hypothetical protein
MKRVLIVSPHFPPVNAPDMQRVRMSLPHFVEAGWEVVVLTVDDREPIAPLEPGLLETIPAAVRVVRVKCFSRRWTRRLGVNNLGLRVWPLLAAAGSRLLAENRFDVVYFSTTQFSVVPLGRLWRWKHGVPYVIDLQDPWLSDYYRQPGAPRPPGGWKYRFARAQARLLEGWTLRKVAHLISVSGNYVTTLKQRYQWFQSTPCSVLTFGAPDRDFVLARLKAEQQPPLLPNTSNFKIAYAGRLGSDMLPALDLLFAGLAAHRDAPRSFEIFFYGTSYAPADQAAPTTAALAAKHGIAHLVHESPARTGYLDSLRLLLESDLTLLLGSDDDAYSPSKIYPTLLAGKPTIAVAPADSVLEQKIHELGGAGLATFSARAPGDGAARARLVELLAQFTKNPATPLGAPLRRELFDREYSAAAIAAKQLRIFADVISAQSPPPTPPDRRPPGGVADQTPAVNR